MKDREFRAWDIKNKKMIYAPALVKRNLFISPDSGNLVDVGYSVVQTFASDFIVEEYTGKRDKDGTKVFKGDRVKSKKSGGIYTIEWDNDKSCFRVIFYLDGERYDSECYSPPGLEILEGGEVVGHIHEEDQ